jgi:hypothetical protein
LEFVGIGHVDIVVVDIPHHLVELATAFNVDLFAVYTFINIEAEKDACQQQHGHY